MHKRKIHLNERAPVSSFKCVECRKVFPTGESLQLHMSKEHEQVPVPPELPEPIHNLAGPHHLHHPHHQALIQPPLLPPGMGYHHQRLHPYWKTTSLTSATFTFSLFTIAYNSIKRWISTINHLDVYQSLWACEENKNNIRRWKSETFHKKCAFKWTMKEKDLFRNFSLRWNWSENWCGIVLRHCVFGKHLN